MLRYATLKHATTITAAMMLAGLSAAGADAAPKAHHIGKLAHLAALSAPAQTTAPSETAPMPAAGEQFGGQYVLGASSQVAGQTVSTWARIGQDDSVLAVGVTMPIGVAAHPPAQAGDGPLGAVAVLPFPRIARESTYFDHFEMHWNPNGHPPACCFGTPHFDLHFYGIPLALVRQVVAPDTVTPSADRMPAGYVYPGVNECVPEMGTHAVKPEDVAPGKFTANMIAGFYQGRMHFIEPMVTRKKLLEKQNFSLEIPRPKELGRATMYPTRFDAIYDAKANAYQFVFSQFVGYAG